MSCSILLSYVRVCFRAGKIKPITNIARLEKKTKRRRELASYARRSCKNMDYKSLTATVSSFSCFAHPVVILSRAWNFLRFPSPNRRSAKRMTRERGRGQKGNENTRGREHQARPICFRWVMSRFAYRNCPWRRNGFARKQTKWAGWHLDTTSVLNLRRWPIRSRD